MNLLKFIGNVAVFMLQMLAYGWLLFLIRCFKRIIATIKGFCAFLKLPHSDQDRVADKCCKFTNPAYHRPDPCIYDQYYLMNLGLAVTWDNPDISLLLNGAVVPKHSLLPNTQYEIDATIWNNSFDAPAVGMRVEFGYLSFGASTVLNPIGTVYVDLGVKGSSLCPATAKMLWTTPATPGHYCIQVNLVWADDANPDNNLGQNNVDVVAAHSPASFSFRLRNNTKTPNTYRFEVDTYSIPTQPACPPTLARADRGTFAERLKRIQAVHSRANFPVPAGWTITFNPAEVALAPGDETDIAVTVDPAPGFAGTTPFNVNVFYGNQHAGGVTVYVQKT